MSPRQVMQSSAKWLVWVVAGASLAGFLFHAAIDWGWLGAMPGANWGPGETAWAVQLPDGRYVISLDDVDRVQIYSSNLQFLYGWNTRGIEGQLRVPADGHLNFYVRGKYGQLGRYVYDVDGTVLSHDRMTARDEATLPGRGAQLVHVPGGSPWWWTYPFRGPFHAFCTFVADLLVAVVLSFVLYTRQEREANARKISSRRAGIGRPLRLRLILFRPRGAAEANSKPSPPNTNNRPTRS